MIEVQHLSKKYHHSLVLSDVSFTLNSGEITCIVGINGAGKTTLMNTIMQLTKPNSGTILLDGQPLNLDSLQRISYIPDHSIVLKYQTIQEALDFMATFYPNFNQQKATRLLDFFKLNRTNRIQQLSKGTIAKVNLLLGLSLDCDYYLMDEPFSGIDMISRKLITDVFTTDLIEGKGVLIASHEINEIEHLIDKVIVLNDGKMVRDFYIETLREKEGKEIRDVLEEVYEYGSIL